MEKTEFQTMAFNLNTMKNNGNDALDCLIFATGRGVEYPDALWMITRLFGLDDDAVSELEDRY